MVFKIPANDIMWSSYDFMQCKRSPDTISASIHNIHFNFTIKHHNKIVAKKIIIICKFNIFFKLFFNSQALEQKEETIRNAEKPDMCYLTQGILSGK